ncbi:MAG: hypothetical protein JWP52_4185 [Rhizobacter sp.]|nr:hypothetical protein [Rhizobacter sp.]
MSVQRSSRALLAALAGLLVLAACGSAPERKPAPLQTVTNQTGIRPAWSARLGSVEFPLNVATVDNTFVVASTDGTVVSLQAATGREVWRANVGAPLAAGVGSDGKFSAVVTRNNELVVLNGGQVAWRERLNGRVLTAPLVAGERVFVVAVDRTVQAFDALDGRKLWTQQRPSDALTLTQASVVVPFKNNLLVGQGPRLTAIDPNNGSVKWDVPIATPRGANEVERLADLVGPVARVGDVVCARSFQAGVGCVNADRGALLWNKVIGGNDGIAADTDNVYGADASDRITAWRTTSGEVAWTSDRYVFRGLTAPLVNAKAVMFGDSEGMVHLLSRTSGEAVGRVATDGSPVVATPVALGGVMLVVTRSGSLTAFTIE